MAEKRHGSWWVLGNGRTFTTRTPVWALTVIALGFAVYLVTIGKSSGGLHLLGLAVLLGVLSAAGTGVKAYARRRAAEQGDE